MIVTVACASLFGVDAYRVDIEVDFSRQGMPVFAMVGLAEGAVREGRERVFTALRNAGLRIPAAKITVNLAPADRKKGGSAYDLALAAGLLAAAGVLPAHSVNDYFLAGELSLTGELRPVPGVLAMAILAKQEGAKGFIVPKGNAQEAAIVDGLPVYAAQTVGEVAAFLAGEQDLPRVAPQHAASDTVQGLYAQDFKDVKGQEHAKRAVEIAAAGGHNILFLGPPGSGKTMLAQRIPSVLPMLDFSEALEVTKIYSVVGLLDAKQALITRRPFRSPHHTISEPGLVGGGGYPKPGEVSLAHRGVLFLDELPEFRKQALEVLRQPLEDGQVTISRAMATLTYPASVMLVAAMNPCPCGYHGDAKRQCVCPSGAVLRYRSKLSGPLLDRIDMHIEVPTVAYEDLAASSVGRSSADMRHTIFAARALQAKRYAQTPISINAELHGSLLEKHCALDAPCRSFLHRAVENLALSARSYTRILRIARTIADLEVQESIALPHLAEALNCRTLDRPVQE